MQLVQYALRVGLALLLYSGRTDYIFVRYVLKCQSSLHEGFDGQYCKCLDRLSRKYKGNA